MYCCAVEGATPTTDAAALRPIPADDGHYNDNRPFHSPICKFSLHLSFFLHIISSISTNVNLTPQVSRPRRARAASLSTISLAVPMLTSNI